MCVDTSTSVVSELSRRWLDVNKDNIKRSPELTRVDEAKNLLKDFVNRVVAQTLPTHMGLVMFSSLTNIRELQSLRPLIVNSEVKLNDAKAGGGLTAIRNALIKAKEMLVAYKEKHPTTICRIILLSDGEENDSITTPFLTCTELLSHQIVLDAMVLGTGADLFRILILESFVNIQMRPPISQIPLTT